MTRVTLSARARRDLRDIGDYIAADNPRAALNFVEALQASCALLRTVSIRGRERPELGPNIRSCPYRAYLVFYRVDPDRDQVFVLRIWHGSRRDPKISDLA